MEELLNKLIEKGWKVYHRNYTKCVNVWRNCAYFMYTNEYGRPKSDIFFNLRELCAKESGLWQFVCENDYWVHKDTYFVEKYTDHIAIRLYQCNDYRYWLLGSALCDEDKLEQFLLDNIKIDEKYTEEEQELIDLDYGTGYTKKFVK